jgi:hypothetical protein
MTDPLLPEPDIRPMPLGCWSRLFAGLAVLAFIAYCVALLWAASP